MLLVVERLHLKGEHLVANNACSSNRAAIQLIMKNQLFSGSRSDAGVVHPLLCGACSCKKQPPALPDPHYWIDAPMSSNILGGLSLQSRSPEAWDIVYLPPLSCVSRPLFTTLTGFPFPVASQSASKLAQTNLALELLSLWARCMP